jgi:hypothetical protein
MNPLFVPPQVHGAVDRQVARRGQAVPARARAAVVCDWRCGAALHLCQHVRGFFNIFEGFGGVLVDFGGSQWLF